MNRQKEDAPSLPPRQTIAGPAPELLTLEEGARLCRFDVTAPAAPVNGFRKWLVRQGVPVLRRGRVLLVERRVLMAYLRGDQWARRRQGRYP